MLTPKVILSVGSLDLDGGQRLGISASVSVSPMLASVNAGQRHDVAGECLVNLDAPEALERCRQG